MCQILLAYFQTGLRPLQNSISPSSFNGFGIGQLIWIKEGRGYKILSGVHSSPANL